MSMPKPLAPPSARLPMYRFENALPVVDVTPTNGWRCATCDGSQADAVARTTMLRCCRCGFTEGYKACLERSGAR